MKPSEAKSRSATGIAEEETATRGGDSVEEYIL